jgi:hypothetical protein
MNDPDIPVLPEFMVARIEEKVNAAKSWNAAMGALVPGGVSGPSKR